MDCVTLLINRPPNLKYYNIERELGVITKGFSQFFHG